ncbi:MAG: EAL domain-containing protein [Clostridiales bacterium]|nr:EAL domain-containing protein [Clostridiales bacterium]
MRDVNKLLEKEAIKILVVDDSASDRLLFKNMLSEYSILTACDGVEAIGVLEENDGIDLLILDLNMPNMDGFQVLEALSEDQRFRKMSTIILTDSDELDNVTKGLMLGVVDYIRKPIHMDSLKVRIDVHLALLRTQQALEQQLKEQTLTFDIIFEQAPIGIAITHNCEPKNPDGSFARINSLFEQITGRTKEEMINLGWAKITHPDDLEEDMKQFRRLQSGEIKIYLMDKRYIKPDGSIVWVHMVVASLTESNDHQYNHICLVQDITERKKIEEALNESERSKSVFLSQLPGLAYRCNYDQEWTMQYVSEGCYHLTGYPAESLLYNRDLSFNDMISPEYRQDLWNKWEEILAERQPFKEEYEIITATGEKKWVLELGQGIYNEQGEVEALEGIVLDISDRKAVEDSLKYNYEHDRWTGLYNRDYLASLLKKEANRNQKASKALVGVNLSTVQLLTANYGFQYTRNLVKKAAETLSQFCTDKCMLFHAYENRFVFYIVDYKHKNELIEFSKAISETLESLFLMERIGGGIGILEIHQDNEMELDFLLRCILVASERAINFVDKDFGICFYDEELETSVNRERDIIEALNHIAADEDTKDELFLHYQPIMNLKTGTICGFEALARLRTEKLGLVPPNEFIPIAEKTKLILPIGEKVIITAFHFLNKLNEYGYDDISISINISAIQLMKTDFTSGLIELMNEMQINPKNVGIEITESIFASDCEAINAIIEELRDKGVDIAIDDFGTGYSSLARERELKVDCMKIDKYFIDKLLSTDLKVAITSDIISISHKLGHYTIAEGVEYDTQLQYLKEHNCDKIQGYLLSKPLDEEDAVKFLKNHKPSDAGIIG